MPRHKRSTLPGIPQHVVQRGNNKGPCFLDEQDFALYARWLAEYKTEFQVDIHAWVFMTNHVHILCTSHIHKGVSKMMQALGRKYVPYFNKKHQRTGTLWEGRFKSSMVDTDEYLLAAYRYIELNPVRARMVHQPNEYHWSSFRANAYGSRSSLRTPHKVYLDLGDTEEERLRAYRSLFAKDVEGEVLAQIREAIQSNKAFGSDAFKKRMELATGQPQEHKRKKEPAH
ncbi:MAG: transposase [Idiomarina sp.]|nr:transposase [Idiomarina sp.]